MIYSCYTIVEGHSIGTNMKSASKVIKSNKFAKDANSIKLRDWCNEAYGRSARVSEIVFAHCKSIERGSSLSHYKNGRSRITPDFWKKLQSAMKQVEKNEIASKKKIPNMRHSSMQHVHQEYQFKSENFDDMKKYFENNPDKVKDFSEHINKEITLDEIRYMRGNKIIVDQFLDFYDLRSKSIFQDRHEYISAWLENETVVKLRLANVIYSHNFANKNNKSVDYYKTPFTNYYKSMLISSDAFNKMKSVMKKVDELIQSNHRFVFAASIG